MSSPGTPLSSPRGTGWVMMRRTPERPMDEELRMILETESKTYHTSQNILYVEGLPNSIYPTARDRDELVSWFKTITHDLHFSITVFYQSTLLLDTFLSTRRIRRDDLQALAASCYSIGTKLVETCDSVVALSHKLVAKYYSQCSIHDVEKMEAQLLQTPEMAWARSQYTIQDYIMKFHSLAERRSTFSLPQYFSLSSHLCHLYKCAQHVVCNHELMKYKPSMLGLAVLGCHLKQLNCDWLSTLLHLEELLQIRGGELSICYEAVAAEFPSYFTSTPLPSSQHTPSKPARHQRRRDPANGSHGDEDEDEEDGGRKDGVIKEKKVMRRKNRRRYRPPTSRTINVAIV